MGFGRWWDCEWRLKEGCDCGDGLVINLALDTPWMKRGKKRKLDPAVEDEWRSEHGDTTDYGGQDGRLWRSVEMRARDTANQPMEKRGDEYGEVWRWEHETQLEEKTEEKTLGYGGEEREKGAKREREQVENEGREGTNEKMAWEGETTGSQFSFFPFFLFLFNGWDLNSSSNGYKKSEVWYLPQHHRSFLYVYILTPFLSLSLSLSLSVIFILVILVPFFFCGGKMYCEIDR